MNRKRLRTFLLYRCHLWKVVRWRCWNRYLGKHLRYEVYEPLHTSVYHKEKYGVKWIPKGEVVDMYTFRGTYHVYWNGKFVHEGVHHHSSFHNEGDECGCLIWAKEQ